MSDKQLCAVCGNTLYFQWSDSHGIGVCIKCGLPYEIYHYEDKKRVDGPPTVAITDEWLPVAHAYWGETKRRVFPAVYDLGFLGGRATSYSGATPEDVDAWEEWLEAHPELVPQKVAEQDGVTI